MIYLTDDLPKFCPECGHQGLPGSRADFFAGCAMICTKCRAEYQYLPSELMPAASRLGSGDLAKYLEE